MQRLLIFFIFSLTTAPIYAQWQVAILPYENRSGDPQLDWVARGISESVVVAFYKVPKIRLGDETLLGDTWQKAVGNAALVNQKNIHVVIRGWYEVAENQLKVHTDIVEAAGGKDRTTLVTESPTLHPQNAVSKLAFGLIENLGIPLESVQETSIQKPRSDNFETYRTTIHAIRLFRRAMRQTRPGADLLAQAETGFKRAIEEDGKNAHAIYYLGRIYEHRENMSEAEATYRKALALDFEHVMARYHLALLFKKQGRSSEAMNELEQTLRQSPLNPDIQTTLSGLFFNQYEQTFESLTAPLEEMIKAVLDDPIGYYELGIAYGELYRYTEAATYFEQALERDSTMADAHFKLGLIFHRNGLHELAVDHLARSAQYGTQFNRVHFRLGEILYLLNRYDEATIEFGKALEKEPNYLIPRFNLGMSQLAQGHIEVAYLTFQNYAELTVDDPRPYVQMGNIHRRKNELQKAISAYETGLKISFSETEAHYYLAYLLSDQGENSEAADHLKTVLRLQPDHPDAISIKRDMVTFSK